MGDEIIKIIGYITDRLGSMGPQVEQAFRVLVEYQRVQGFVTLIPAAVFMALAVGLVVIMVKIRRDWVEKENSQRRFDSFGHVMVIVVLGFGVVIFAGISAAFAADAIAHIMAPEYYAIKELLGAVKPH